MLAAKLVNTQHFNSNTALHPNGFAVLSRDLSAVAKGARDDYQSYPWPGFEPTTVRSKTTSQRTRPLGHMPRQIY